MVLVALLPSCKHFPMSFHFPVWNYPEYPYKEGEFASYVSVEGRVEHPMLALDFPDGYFARMSYDPTNSMNNRIYLEFTIPIENGIRIYGNNNGDECSKAKVYLAGDGNICEIGKIDSCFDSQIEFPFNNSGRDLRKVIIEQISSGELRIDAVQNILR